MGLKYLAPGIFGGQSPQVDIVLTPQAAEIKEGHHPVLTLTNNSDAVIKLPNRCPAPPVDIAAVTQSAGGGEELTDLIANETAIPCPEFPAVEPHTKATIDLAPWKYSLFSALGTYEASLTIDTASGGTVHHDIITSRFTIKEPGVATKLFRAIVTKPLLNLLVLIASYIPDHNLGVAIILLTIIVKVILLVPNQHALEGQRKLQTIQPRLDELKKKYADDQKKLQEETMKLWRQHNINPLQSCLPLLLQFPVLIGLFYVIRDGVVLDLSRHLLYPSFMHLDWHFATTFLGLDLTKPNVIIMPIALVALQYYQMRLALLRTKKKQPLVIDQGKPKFTFDQQTVMLYALPLMIGFFALRFQAAVSLYWGVSTVFAIAQQWYVNRKN